MGMGHEFNIESMREKKNEIHPAWVGIGCILVVGLGALGYFLGNWFIISNAQSGWIALPIEWAAPAENPYLIVKLIFALFTLLIGSALISILYTLINPPKPGKYDVTDPSILPPPPRRRK